MRRPEKADLRVRKPFGDARQNIKRSDSTRAELQKRDRRKERDERNDNAHVADLSKPVAIIMAQRAKYGLPFPT
jgi:hypothetical protein